MNSNNFLIYRLVFIKVFLYFFLLYNMFCVIVKKLFFLNDLKNLIENLVNYIICIRI